MRHTRHVTIIAAVAVMLTLMLFTAGVSAAADTHQHDPSATSPPQHKHHHDHPMEDPRSEHPHPEVMQQAQAQQAQSQTGPARRAHHAQPRFTQRLAGRGGGSPYSFAPSLRHWHDTWDQQMRLANLMHRLTSPFTSLFAPQRYDAASLADPFAGQRQQQLLQPRRPSSPSSLWSSWWRDPFEQLDWFGGPELNEWPSELWAHDERPLLQQQQGQQGGSALTPRGDPLPPSALSSSFSLQELPDKFALDASLPGWEGKDVTVEIEGDQLVLTGERREKSTLPGGEGASQGAESKAQEARGEVERYAYFRKAYTLPPDVLASLEKHEHYASGGTGEEAITALFDPDSHTLHVEVRKPQASLAEPPKREVKKVPVQQRAQIQQPHAQQAQQKAEAPVEDTPASRIQLKDELR